MYILFFFYTFITIAVSNTYKNKNINRTCNIKHQQAVHEAENLAQFFYTDF